MVFGFIAPQKMFPRQVVSPWVRLADPSWREAQFSITDGGKFNNELRNKSEWHRGTVSAVGHKCSHFLPSILVSILWALLSLLTWEFVELSESWNLDHSIIMYQQWATEADSQCIQLYLKVFISWDTTVWKDKLGLLWDQVLPLVVKLPKQQWVPSCVSFQRVCPATRH